MQVPGWKPEIFPGSGLEPGSFSGFRVGTWKFFRVPGWNPEPGNFWVISGFFRIVFQPGKIMIFLGFSGLEPGTRNSGGNPSPTCTSCWRTAGALAWIRNSRSWLRRHQPDGAWRRRGCRGEGGSRKDAGGGASVDQHRYERQLICKPQQACWHPVCSSGRIPGV